jgi:hypothetical protein
VAEPALTPVTMPLASTLAIPLLLLDQLPPVVLLVYVVVEPTHILVTPPDIAAGDWFTVSSDIVRQPPVSV